MTDPRPTPSADAPEVTSGVAALIALIEGSSILTRAPAPTGWAPAGYDATDVRILDWIASHRPSPRRVMPAELAA
jgi:hypothetical protein